MAGTALVDIYNKEIHLHISDDGNKAIFLLEHKVIPATVRFINNGKEQNPKTYVVEKQVTGRFHLIIDYAYLEARGDEFWVHYKAWVNSARQT